MKYSGAQGILINEKELKSKISSQTPFNMIFRLNKVSSLNYGISDQLPLFSVKIEKN